MAFEKKNPFQPVVITPAEQILHHVTPEPVQSVRAEVPFETDEYYDAARLSKADKILINQMWESETNDPETALPLFEEDGFQEGWSTSTGSSDPF